MNLNQWDTDPILIGGLLLLAVLYRQAVGRLRHRLAPGEPFPVRQALWIDGMLVLFYLTVGSPLDYVSERFLLSVHMIQHTLLVFVLPIMFIKGMPPWLLRPLLTLRWLRPLVRFALQPVVALVSFNVIFGVWHIPGLYDWALRDIKVHETEHLAFLVAGVQMWWPLFSTMDEFPRLSYGGQVLYMFFMSISQIPIFAYLVFSTNVVYPAYEAAPRLFAEVSPLRDQVLGGIIMKFVGELFFAGAIVVALIKWYQEENPGRAYHTGSRK